MTTIIYHIPGVGTLARGRPFSHDGIKYPANWLEHATAPELAALGITVEEVTPSEPEPQPATVDDIMAERSRRLSFGFLFDFGDARGVHHIGTTDADMSNWREVTDAAQAAIALGNGADPLTIVLTNTGAASITAMDWMHILDAVRIARQPIWGASFALQTMDPIPADYADDSHWPPISVSP